MSDKELSRVNVIQSVVKKRMRRRDAAHQLVLTERQTQRLINRASMMLQDWQTFGVDASVITGFLSH